MLDEPDPDYNPDYDPEVYLTNFHDGDKSLWTRTTGACRLCGDGTIWIVTVYFVSNEPPEYCPGACDGCQGSGTCEGLLEINDEGNLVEIPVESRP